MIKIPVDVKGQIKYNPGVKDHPDYMIVCPQLGISMDGFGDIEKMIKTLREQVTRAITDEFKVAPSTVQITAYSMGLNFSIEGPTNHTLDKFVKNYEKEGIGAKAND